MNPGLIADDAEFEDLCAHIRDAGTVAFDTEFVSEHTYQPELCLLQFATPERTAAVDPFEVDDLSPWWRIMTDDETTVVVHGGQAEIRFCRHALDESPRRLVDVQVAEGLRSRSYPLGYGALVARVLDVHLPAGETRTDWRRRPLSDPQIEYALEDVSHVLEIWRRQSESLRALGRLEWAEAEFQGLIASVEAEMARRSWERVSGLHKLSARELAVAQEICEWREAEARSRNKPARRVLRDDLVIELARRKPQDMKSLTANRDMNRSDYRKAAPDLLKCVKRAMALPKEQLPRPDRNRQNKNQHDEHALSQLLGIALANRCIEAEVARSLVGTTTDLKQLVRRHVGGETDGEPPGLMQGWRAEVCGDLLTDVLDGRISLRVADPESDHPLVFERCDP